MPPTFDDEWAGRTVAQLRERGQEFTGGLQSEELDEIAAVFGTPVPPELALLLREGVPASPDWADWRAGPHEVAASAWAWISRAFSFDIDENDYWHPRFGERPDVLADAIDQALAVVAAAPPLIPIYGHRYLCSAPSEGTRPVLSVWQAVDSVVYGHDLAHYLAAEFGTEPPPWPADEALSVPVWEDLFDLWCTGQETST